MTGQSRLAAYPELVRWHRQRASRPPACVDASEYLVFRTCEALGVSADVGRWIEDFGVFLGATPDPLRHFLSAQSIMHECDAELLTMLGDFGQTAVEDGCARAFYDVMSRGADATGLAVMRFLAAWAAFNHGDLAACVEQCDKADEPYAALFTLQGQALLELGKAAEAMKVLEAATRLAPGEILAWFQLAKACHLLDQHRAAVAAVEAASRLAPGDAEVALLYALIAVEDDVEGAAKERAYHALKPHLAHNRAMPATIFSLTTLGLQLRDKPKVRHVLANSDWVDAARKPDFVGRLARTLRTLAHLGWMDVSAELLTRLTPETHS
jgi:tetratricopeptide (TPR) repeat protein